LRLLPVEKKTKTSNARNVFSTDALVNEFHSVRKKLEDPKFLERLLCGDGDAYAVAALVLEPCIRKFTGRRGKKEEYANNYIKQVFGDGGHKLVEWCRNSANKDRLFRDFVSDRNQSIAERMEEEKRSADEQVKSPRFRDSLERALAAYAFGGQGDVDRNQDAIKLLFLNQQPANRIDPAQINRAVAYLYRFMSEKEGPNGANIRRNCGISADDWTFCLDVLENNIFVRTRSDEHIRRHRPDRMRA
jgi:hypothetical protein